MPDPLSARPRLSGDIDVDVAIVGAGYTGLWTAYYLTRSDPAIKVAVIEREIAGFGASGRNGGWCSAMFATSPARLVRTYGEAAERSLRKALEARSLGIGEADLSFLDAAAAAERVSATGVLGALYTRHCASIHPARLARGLAEVVERRGVHLFEHTPAEQIQPGRVVTAGGVVRAAAVVRATEGFSPQLPRAHRDVIPFYSLMIATEPLPNEVLDQIGLRDGETFADMRHLVIYGQRTAEGRIAFGGRGAPYHFGSRIRADFDTDGAIHEHVRETLAELFPVLRGFQITHRWGGPLAIARDWHPSVGFDRTTGLGWAGGYVGDGVAVSNLAGRTLAALITGGDDETTKLCWVGHRSRRWEVEPLRWIGVNSALHAMASADRAEERSGRPSRLAGAMSRLTGG